MSAYPHLSLSRPAPGVALVAIDRPEARNALNAAVLDSLARVFQDLSSDADCRAVILRGTGEKAFCAGADLKEWQARDGIAAYREHFGAVAKVVEGIGKCTKPIIAAVDGFALAGGCGLAAACDVTIATRRSVFGLPEVKIGLLPAIVMAPIFRAVGWKKAVELALRGNRIGGEEAERIGLVTRCVDEGKLEEEALALAKEFSSLSPLVLKMGKEAIHQLGDMEYFASLKYLRDQIASLSTSQDAHEGVASFFENREPVWKGK